MIAAKQRSRAAKSTAEQRHPTKPLRNFEKGDLVYYRTAKAPNQLVKARVMERISPLVFQIKILHSDFVINSHLDSIKPCFEQLFSPNNNITQPLALPLINSPNDNQRQQLNVRRRSQGLGLRKIPRIQYY